MAAHMALDNLFVREYELRDGGVLNVSQCEVGDVGCVVWDAAIVLSAYLETDDCTSLIGKSPKRDGRLLDDQPESAGSQQNHLAGCSVVELGAGTGIVGLVAAVLGASSLITDLPECIPLIDHNIKANLPLLRGTVKAMALPWGTHDATESVSQPDCLIFADCIYYEESISPLVHTVNELAGPQTTVLCCHEERTTGNKPKLQKQFFELMERTFKIEKISIERQHPVFRSQDIHIHKFLKK